MSRLPYAAALMWLETHERGELDTPATDDELRDRPTVALVAFLFGRSVERVIEDVMGERVKIAEAEERSMESPETESAEKHPCSACSDYAGRGRCRVFRTVAGHPRSVSGRCNAYRQSPSESAAGKESK